MADVPSPEDADAEPKEEALLTTTILASSRTDTAINDEIPLDAFPQGCQFSPDGFCVLTATGPRIELYNTPFERLTTPQGQREDDRGCNEADEVPSSPPPPSSWRPVLTYPTGDSVRCYGWYPHMSSSDPASCCFVGVSRDQPCHLYDAYSGSVRATYCPYNALDEMESPAALAFADRGQRLVMGGFRTDRMVHVFDVNRPGRDSASVLKLGKTRRSKDGQKGLVSALRCSESLGLVAVGTYSPGSVYLYDLRTYSRAPAAEVIMTGTCVAGHGRSNHGRKRKHFISSNADDDGGGDGVGDDGGLNFSAAKLQWFQSRVRGGVTQLEFDEDNSGTGGSGAASGDCKYLFSTSRRSNAILQWDLRKLSSSSFCPGVASFETDNDTNQRIEFQLHNRQIWTGGRDACIRVYDRQNPGRVPARKLQGFGDCVNGISLNRFSQSGDTVLSLTTGSRHFPSLDFDGGDSDGGDDGGFCGTTESLSRPVGTTQIHRVNWNG